MHAARKDRCRGCAGPGGCEAVAKEIRLLAFDEMQITDITDAMIVGRLFQMLFAVGRGGGRHLQPRAGGTLQGRAEPGRCSCRSSPFCARRWRSCISRARPTTDSPGCAARRVYFHPAGTAAGKIDAIWRDLAGGPGEPLHLAVNGRDVVVPRFANGVGRATFWDLCARPLGPADYLAIADSLRVLVLEDIPQLSASNYNEAKRFVTLIDALYEARVRLVASAADAPERLYIEGAGSFEFERTASRLREMQAEDWGK